MSDADRARYRTTQPPRESRCSRGIRLQAGKVLFHSPDQDEVCRKAMEYPPGRYALRFQATIPEDLVLVL